MKNAILIFLLLITFNSFGQIICPSDITLNCDQDYMDTLVIGNPIIHDSIDLEDVSIDFTPELNACNAGTVSVSYSLDSNVLCTQIVTVVNPFSELDSSTIVFPMDTTYITCYRPYEEPTWIAADCDFIGYTESIDTISFTSEYEYILERTLTVIDWCLYDESNGSEGLYSGSHIISLIDETPPIALCFSFFNYFPSEFPLTIEAKNLNWASGADCASYSDLRFTFSDIPPELDPNFNNSINTSIREIQLDEFDENSLWVDMYVWDPSGNFSFCSMPIFLNPECPSDLTLNCDQDYTDLSLTVEAVINSNSEFDSITSVIYTPNLDACGVGTVLIEHQAEDSILCTQIITIINPYPLFDPSSIIIPNDTVYTNCALWEEGPPTWTGGPCDFIGYTEDLDTFDFINESSFKLLREITVIDWCLYDQTDGAEGLYFGSQEITVIDEIPPTPNCPTTAEYSIDVLPITITAISIGLDAVDNCTENKDLRFTFTETPPELDPDFDASINSSTRVLTAAEFLIGTYFIDVYHWDLAGNSSVCTVILGSLTVTEDLDEGVIQVLDNYPNPFNESTTIIFNLQESRDINITIYDIGGKEYVRLSEYFTAGEHRKKINLSDAPSGILFYKLETNNSVAVRKMMKL